MQSSIDIRTALQRFDQLALVPRYLIVGARNLTMGDITIGGAVLEHLDTSERSYGSVVSFFNRPDSNRYKRSGECMCLAMLPT